jgi:hypothetical protein
MGKDLFLGTLDAYGNMKLEAHVDGLESDIHCVELEYGYFAGYVEEPGIEEEVVPVLSAVNSHVWVAISSDDDSQTLQDVES